MTDFLTDFFLGVDGTDLGSHTPDLGGSWSVNASGITIQSNHLEVSGFNQREGSNAAAPPSADYDVEADITLVTAGMGSEVRLYGRQSFGAGNSYAAVYDDVAQLWRLQVFAGAFPTDLDTSPSPVFTSGTHTMLLHMSGSSLELHVDSSVVCSGVDTSYSSPGTAGVYMYNYTPGSISLDNLHAGDIVSGVGGGPGVHSGLTSVGFISVGTCVAVRVDITGLPIGVGQGQGNPTRYFNLGSISFSDDAVYYSRNYYIEHIAELVVFPFNPVASIGYSFAPGLTATITEVPTL